MEYGLGRIIDPDVRDYLPQNRMSSIVSAAAPLPEYFSYVVPQILNQGETKECTAFAWNYCLAINGHTDLPDPHAFYEAEQQIDGIPIPHDGSTVRAGAKIAQDEGFITSYVWDGFVGLILPFIAYHGPVIFGTSWTSGMFVPDPVTNIIHATGDTIGGHAYVILGFDLRRALLRGVCAWGDDWADKGYFWLPFDDANRLLLAQGEACAPIITPQNHNVQSA